LPANPPLYAAIATSEITTGCIPAVYAFTGTAMNEPNLLAMGTTVLRAISKVGKIHGSGPAKDLILDRRRQSIRQHPFPVCPNIKTKDKWFFKCTANGVHEHRLVSRQFNHLFILLIFRNQFVKRISYKGLVARYFC
jgi:hypothetical protein